MLYIYTMEYWESRFNNEGAMWSFEPSDSAILALKLFKDHGIRNILIPGFGYGRNAKIFQDNGFKITGIEISGTAVSLAKSNGLNCLVYQGSVTSMPFDTEEYDGIFCYALIHLLNKPERKKFLESCYNQLRPGGLMVFSVASKQMSLFGDGKYLSKDRYMVSKGLNVFFYDHGSVVKEFADFGIIEYRDIEEPIKYMTGYDPVKLILVICQKK
jgi:SAM-dependent methyltransferase